MDKILYAINGRFGNKVLKLKYRRIWKTITYGIISFLFVYISIQIIQIWDVIVRLLNFLVWGN